MEIAFLFSSCLTIIDSSVLTICILNTCGSVVSRSVNRAFNSRTFSATSLSFTSKSSFWVSKLCKRASISPENLSPLSSISSYMLSNSWYCSIDDSKLSFVIFAVSASDVVTEAKSKTSFAIVYSSFQKSKTTKDF